MPHTTDKTDFRITAVWDLDNRFFHFMTWISILCSSVSRDISISLIHSHSFTRLYSPLLGTGRFFSFVNLCPVGGTPWTGDQPVARSLPIHRTTQTQNKHTQTSMPRVGFEPTTPAFEREKTVHASDREAAGSQLSVSKRWSYYHSLTARDIKPPMPTQNMHYQQKNRA
jgi:hypothetical protein